MWILKATECSRMHSHFRTIKGNWGEDLQRYQKPVDYSIPDPVYSLDHEFINCVSSLTLVCHLKLSKIGSTIFRESKEKIHSIGHLLYYRSSTGHGNTTKGKFGSFSEGK